MKSLQVNYMVKFWKNRSFKIMRNSFIIVFFIFFTSVVFSQIANGNIETYMSNIIDNMPGSSGNDYVVPNTSQLNTWNTVINFILDDNLQDARSNTSSINYQITEFTDTSVSPDQVFYILEENIPQSNYWGTYVFSKTPTRNNLIIQAPHSKFDTNTGKQAVYCFKRLVARALFINGTHRCNSIALSSCSGTTSVCGSSDSYRVSDMAHSTNSMFQKTTENLFNNISNSVFIQLHGFAKRTTDPYVIMSNGTRETPETDYAVLIKDELILEDGTLTFELVHINTSWSRLTGFTNTQGRLINNSDDPCGTSAIATSGRFIHIEQEKSKLRNDESKWNKMSNALINVFFSTLSIDDIGSKPSISVSPNPAREKFIITGNYINHIEIYNSFGQKIVTKINVKNEKSLIIELDKINAGIYFLKITTDIGITSRKLIHL